MGVSNYSARREYKKCGRPYARMATSTGTQKFATRLSEATEAGQKFVALFYEAFDKRRQVRFQMRGIILINAHHLAQVIKGLYSETSFLVWNGHTKSGANDINAFYQNFPSSCHRIHSLDCQPVSGRPIYHYPHLTIKIRHAEKEVNLLPLTLFYTDGHGRTTVLVCCEGIVGYEEQSREQPFTQNFLLVKQSDVWKVGSDCFRFLD